MAKNTTKKITSIGGSALIEGIMMRGPKRTTVCVRTCLLYTSPSPRDS